MMEKVQCVERSALQCCSISVFVNDKCTTFRNLGISGEKQKLKKKTSFLHGILLYCISKYAGCCLTHHFKCSFYGIKNIRALVNCFGTYYLQLCKLQDSS